MLKKLVFTVTLLLLTWVPGGCVLELDGQQIAQMEEIIFEATPSYIEFCSGWFYYVPAWLQSEVSYFTIDYSSLGCCKIQRAVDWISGSAVFIDEITREGRILLYGDNGLLGTKDFKFKGEISYFLQRIETNWEIANMEYVSSTEATNLDIFIKALEPQPVKLDEKLQLRVSINNGESSEFMTVLVGDIVGNFEVLYDENPGDGEQLVQCDFTEGVTNGRYYGGLQVIDFKSLTDLTKDETGQFIVPAEIKIQSFGFDVW